MANFGKAEISLLFKPAASVPLLKILNVSERTGMSVVPRSSDVFAQQKLADEKCTRTYIFHHNIASKSKETVQKLLRNPL